MRPATDPAVPATAAPRRPFGEHSALGMAIFIFTEVMLFAGFFSAFVIVRKAVPEGAWPPPDQPQLPFERTAFNTLALLLSGVALFVAGRRFRRQGAAASQPWMAAAMLLGTLFVALQGGEWVALLGQGLTLTSSQLGSFFYVIIGTHALHCLVAIFALGVAWQRMMARKLTESRLIAVEMFWYFVVLVWPALYLLVYR